MLLPIALALTLSPVALLTSSKPLPSPASDAPAISSLADLNRRAGPSGHLEAPAGGSNYTNLGGATGDIYVAYRGVSDGGDDGDARTIAIDVALVPRLAGTDDGRVNVTLANGLRQMVSGSSDAIYGSFVPPVSACGDYDLAITEHQFYNDAVIQFLSAAPQISITCGPIQ